MENAPQCIGCGQTDHMVPETSTATMEHFHCNFCGSKTQRATWFGKLRPFIGLATLFIFGFKIN